MAMVHQTPIRSLLLLVLPVVALGQLLLLGEGASICHEVDKPS